MLFLCPNARGAISHIGVSHTLSSDTFHPQGALLLAEEEFQRERAMVDEVVRRIQEEDVAEDALRRQRQDETKAFIRGFLVQKEADKRQRVEAMQAEERKIQARKGAFLLLRAAVGREICRY